MARMMLLVIAVVLHCGISLKAAVLLSDSRKAQLVELLPSFVDPSVRETLLQGVFYDEEAMPRAHQAGNDTNRGGVELRGIHSSYHNVSANRSEPFGNANREFPWNLSGGLSSEGEDKTTGFKILNLTGPVVYYYDNQAALWKWMFPFDSRVTEVLLVQRSGRWWPYEVRQRIRTPDTWDVRVYAPFQSKGDVEQILGYQLPPLKTGKLTVSSKHRRPAYKNTVRYEVLPALRDADIEKLLSTPMALVESRWSVSADTTQSVLPHNYMPALVGADIDSCAECHRTTQQLASTFDVSRDWYHNVRGSDGILSFHPFDRRSISRNGMGGRAIFNQKLIDAGVIAKYNPQLHTADKYKPLPQEYYRARTSDVPLPVRGRFYQRNGSPR